MSGLRVRIGAVQPRDTVETCRLSVTPPKHEFSPRLFPGCEQLLQRARDSLRRGNVEHAHACINECGDGVLSLAPFLNVSGLIAEARGDWKTAKRLWGRAVRADRRYYPARHNLRRWFELAQLGESALGVA